MPLGINLGLWMGCWAGSGAFAPASLFGVSDQGFAFDFSDMSKLYQDSAGTTPVTAVTQPVGKVLDISGKGNHATQATAGSRPLFQTGRAVFDGTDDTLATASINMTGGNAVTIVAAVNIAVTQVGTIVANPQGAAGAAGGYTFKANNVLGANGPMAGTVYDGVGPSVYHESAAVVVPRTIVYTGLIDTSAGVGAEIIIRSNGVVKALTADAAGPVATTAIPNSVQYVGAANASNFLNGSIYRLLLINRILGAAEIAQAETWAGQPAGISL